MLAEEGVVENPGRGEWEGGGFEVAKERKRSKRRRLHPDLENVS